MSKKMTRKAMLTSVVALAICFAMLVGATYAWFTDSVSSVGNKIKAGTLDIDLYQFDGNDWVEITDQSAPIFGSDQSAVAQNVNTDTLWEPGKTQVAYLKLVNNGNLWLKYSVAVDVKNVANDLYEAMRYEIIPDAQPTAVAAWDAAAGVAVTTGKQATAAVDVPMPPEAEHYFALALHMQEDAGNEYQTGEVDFDLKIVATQYTAEPDSFNNQYDADAEYPPIVVADAAELATALANGETNIKLTPNVDYGTLTLGNTTDLEDVTIDAEDAQMLMDIQSGAKLENVVIKNYEPTGAITGSYNGSVTIRDGADVNITFEDCTFKPETSSASCIRSYETNAKLHFEGCTFDGTGSRYAFYRSGDAIDELEFVNCTFQNFTKRVIMWNGSSGKAAKIVIDGCTFKDSNPVDGLLKMGGGGLGDNSIFQFTNNALSNFVPTEGFFTTNKSDVTAPIYLNNDTFTVSVSGNTKDGVAWDPQGLVLN